MSETDIFPFMANNTVNPLSKDRISVFKTNYRLMQVKRSILQYFRPSLGYHLSLRFFVFSIFERPFYTGLKPVLLYLNCNRT